MPTALFLSPHLDDVAFSCGGTLAKLAAAGWRTVLATVFTRSVPDPRGFALACQTDKGLPADADYMAIRRTEDATAGRALGATEVLWLDFPEAPHRGYGSASELFAGTKPGDDVWAPVSNRLLALAREVRPDVAFGPQGCGRHVDHLHVIRAIAAAGLAPLTAWYRDTPYVIRDPAADADESLRGRPELAVAIGDHLPAKLAACAAYRTQFGFQFGGEPAMREKLTALAAREATRTGVEPLAEVFLVGDAARSALPW